MVDRIVSYSGNDYGLRELHNHTLLFLEMLDAHCKKYSIKYSLAYGSMLGCVRSHGFIPWDDDVDIVMMRTDYDRLIESLSNQDTDLSKKCSLYCPRYINKLLYVVDDDERKQSYTMYMDLFAADIVHKNPFLEKCKSVAIILLKNIIVGRTVKKSIRFSRKIRRILAHVVSFPFSVEKLKKMYLKLALWGSKKPSDKFSCYYASHLSYGISHNVDIFKNVKYMPFEDIELPVMEGYHKYLTTEFGDYMTPPPQKDRHATHAEGWN